MGVCAEGFGAAVASKHRKCTVKESLRSAFPLNVGGCMPWAPMTIPIQLNHDHHGPHTRHHHVRRMCLNITVSVCIPIPIPILATMPTPLDLSLKSIEKSMDLDYRTTYWLHGLQFNFISLHFIHAPSGWIWTNNSIPIIYVHVLFPS